MQNHDTPRVHLDVVSVVLGISSGILATLIFATYKQREFDALIKKSREVASGAGEMVDHVADQAKQLVGQAEHAVTDGARAACKASKETIDAARSTVH